MTVTVEIEIPRFSLIKREQGRIEYVSPIPCPFNYGCIPDRPAPDGDPADAVVLGPTLTRGALVQCRVYGVVRFIDDGVADDKLICGDHPPTTREQQLIKGFFTIYAPIRAALNRLKGRAGRTAFLGITAP